MINIDDANDPSNYGDAQFPIVWQTRHCCDTLTNLRHAIPEPQYLLITNIIL